MDSSTNKKPSTHWIKIWVALGVLVLLGSVLVPIGASIYAAKDIQRYNECVAGTRTDCEDSLVWALYEQALLYEGAEGLSGRYTEEEYRALLGESNGEGSKLEDRVRTLIRTSDAAALITKAELKDMSLAGGWYRAKAGTEIMVTATIEGEPDSVEIYIADKNPAKDGISRMVSKMEKGEEGVYTGSFTIDSGLLGELEIRASGPKKESASLFLNVAAE
ncbi:hypothetical protein IT407_03960 [Candidatus Uhrbacteria bacterium]|nr:hypothetical protein [Candidatus Uhrbacteria bacterium]